MMNANVQGCPKQQQQTLFTAQREQGSAAKRCNLLGSLNVLHTTEGVRLRFKMWEVTQL